MQIYTVNPLKQLSFGVIPLALAVFLTSAIVPTSAWAAGSRKFCSQTAKIMLKACGAEAKDDYLVATAYCVNLSELENRRECNSEARGDQREALQECKEVHRARIDLCNAIGEERYDPDFSPSNFVHPDSIGNSVEPNPFFPLVPGIQWIYQDQAGEEQITVTVTDKIKLIEGVSVRVITDIVEKNGLAAEITDDWVAQDLAGNVWYAGEVSRDFEVFVGDVPVEPELVEIGGSWKTGRESAKPGILMFRNPVVGTTYRQEVKLGDAEDVAQVISITGTESVPAAACSGNCVVTRDFTPLSPDSEEFKYYAPGVGLILETDAEGNRVELIDFQQP